MGRRGRVGAEVGLANAEAQAMCLAEPRLGVPTKGGVEWNMLQTENTIKLSNFPLCSGCYLVMKCEIHGPGQTESDIPRP